MQWKELSLLVVCLASANPAVARETTLLGNVSKVTTGFVEIEGKTFPLKNGASNDVRASSREVTECWAGTRTTCGTLAGVGYIQKAKVTVRDGVAVRIEVLEMLQ